MADWRISGLPAVRASECRGDFPGRGRELPFTAVFELAVFAIGAVVGVVGGLLGIGGGVFIIPIFTVILHVPIKLAIGASLVSVIATSSMAGAAHVGHGVSHVKLGIVLEVATTMGAVAGGLLATAIGGRWLEGGFALLLVATAFGMRRMKTEGEAVRPTGVLDTRYVDPATGTAVRYGVHHLPAGMGASFFAGGMSGLLGIGGGVVKVPMMTVVMGIPLRAAIATSNFMIGVTAATSALIYLSRGYVAPYLAVPTALGVLLGAGLEPRLGMRVRSASLKRVFQLLLVGLAVQMLWKAVHA